MPRRVALLGHGPEPREMASRIRAERMRLAITQEEAAARLGVSRERYRDLEDEANPQYATLCALVVVLRMDPRVLAPELARR